MAPAAAQVLGIARTQLGYTEPGLSDAPGTQVTKFGHWYATWAHQSGYVDTYWCAMFCSWVFANSGFAIAEAGRFGNCGPWIRWWKGQHRWAGRNSPSVGAQVFFDWDGDGVAEHVGLVESIRPDGRLVTLEGNATIGGGKHDGVYRMVRGRSYILGYGLPPYGTGAPAPAAKTAVSLTLPGPIAIGAGPDGKYGTSDARKVPAGKCPVLARGFGGPENITQRTWAAYWYRLMGTYSPGYFRQITATPAGQAEVTRAEIGPVTIAVAERMTREKFGPKTPPFRGVIVAQAWQIYQPT